MTGLYDAYGKPIDSLGLRELEETTKRVFTKRLMDEIAHEQEVSDILGLLRGIVDQFGREAR